MHLKMRAKSLKQSFIAHARRRNLTRRGVGLKKLPFKKCAALRGLTETASRFRNE